MEYLDQVGVDQIPRSPYSPDQNPIENLCDVVDLAVRQRDPPPQTLADLRVKVVEEWKHIPQRKVNRLVDNMPIRIRSLDARPWGHTKY